MGTRRNHNKACVGRELPFRRGSVAAEVCSGTRRLSLFFTGGDTEATGSAASYLRAGRRAGGPLGRGGACKPAELVRPQGPCGFGPCGTCR